MDGRLIRHFTATGYIARRDAILLHWHGKLRMWLPPGGHIEPNEDPVQAVLREAREETGLAVQLLPSVTPFQFRVPEQLQPPVTILVEDIDDPVEGFHQHIDSIYFLALADGEAIPLDGWKWVSEHELASCAPIQTPSGEFVAPLEDVQEVGQKAIAHLKVMSETLQAPEPGPHR